MARTFLTVFKKADLQSELQYNNRLFSHLTQKHIEGAYIAMVAEMRGKELSGAEADSAIANFNSLAAWRGATQDGTATSVTTYHLARDMLTDEYARLTGANGEI